MPSLLKLIRDNNTNEALAMIQTGNFNPEQVDNNGNTALMIACKYEMSNVSMALIQTGQSKPEQVSKIGNTALMLACNNKMSEVALALIQSGQSKPEQVNNNGSTALMLACKNNMPDVALALIQTGQSKPEQVNKNGITALILVCDNKMSEVALALIQTGQSKPEHVDYNRQTALMYACNNNMPNVALALIQSGQSKPEQVDYNRQTALMLACNNNMPDVAMALIQTGQFKPEQVNSNGYTALILACKNNMPEVALALIQTDNSRPRQVDNTGRNALTYALQNIQTNGMQQVVDLLRPLVQVEELGIHKAFAKIPIIPLVRFIKTTIDSPPPPPNNFKNYIGQTINLMITNSVTEKEKKQGQFNRIMQSRLNGLRYSDLSPVMLETIYFALEFAKRQPPDFIEYYLSTFFFDCENAHENGMSCAGGILERLVSSLYGACKSENSKQVNNSEEPYKSYNEIMEIFQSNPVVLCPLYIKEWYQIHNIANKANNPSFYSKSHEEKKQMLKNYLLEKMPGQEEIINSNVAEYTDAIGLDEDSFTYGGKRRHTRKTRKRRKKTRYTRNKRKKSRKHVAFFKRQ